MSAIASLFLWWSVEFLVIALIVVSVIVTGLLALTDGALKLLRALRLLRNDPVPIHSIVSATGPVPDRRHGPRGRRTITAPDSGEQCLVCEYESYTGTGKYQLPAGHGRAHTMFYVEDDSATVRVNPGGARLNFQKATQIVSSKEDVTEALDHYVAEHTDWGEKCGFSPCCDHNHPDA